jgi:cystathionine beta-synthase
MIYENILKAIGNTPIVKLNKVTKSSDANIFAKLEFMNPGGSIKDRIGWWLVEDAEKKGLLKPGGTIVEGTSGNTGFGLAIAAAVKGYKSIFVLPDKMSEEKIKNLRAFGAKVVVTPTAVEPEDPRSYYSVSKRLAKDTPNSFYTDQYNNPANREAHYVQTGPEILEQMPDIDIFIAGIGTGGTICGVGKYLKEKKPGVKVVAVDPVGSIVYDYFKTGKMTEAKTYKIEGIGEDFIPLNYDFSVIDDMVRVEDKESFLATRELLSKEGIYSGVSSGSAVVGALRWLKEQGDAVKGKNVLIMLPDSGNRYLSKVYDDDWMEEAGYLEKPPLGSVQDLLNKVSHPEEILMAKQGDKVSSAIETMRDKGISQLPIKDDQGWIKGIIKEKSILTALFENKVSANDTIDNIMDTSIEFVAPTDSVEKVARLVSGGKLPLVADPDKQGNILAIITTSDLVAYLGQ